MTRIPFNLNSSVRFLVALSPVKKQEFQPHGFKYPLDTVLEGEVVSVTDFGVFVKIDEELEGLVYSSEIDKDKALAMKPGDKMQIKVIKVDVEQAKIGLSAKV